MTDQPLTETTTRITSHGRRVHWRGCATGLSHISVSPERRSGQPCIDDRRITVADVLSPLADHAPTRAYIQEQYPYAHLSDQAIVEALEFAARVCRDWEPQEGEP